MKPMKKFIFTFEDSGDYWKIRIDNLLHMIISKEGFLGIRSYVNGIKSKAYYIDIIYTTTIDTVTYKTKELWLDSLKTIDENII